MAGHAIVVPYPGRGHINPMMHLARKLASHGISATFVLTESWHKIVTEAEDDVFSHAQKLGLDIQAALIPDCVVGGSKRWGNMADFFLSLSNMEIHVNELITNLKRSGTATSCIVADTFLRWAVPLAKRHNLLSVALWPMSVTTFSIFYHSDLVGLQGRIDYIPGMPPLTPADLPSALYASPSPVTDEIAQCFINVREADWVVGNSFYALDCKAIDALLHKTPVQSVGPLNMPSVHWGDEKGASQCSQWLDSKPAQSVIYVSFGSFVEVSRAQVREIAMGLMQSGYCFVWALRPDKEASHVWEMLPAGYLEQCKEQGLVAPWFRQGEILSHPSVGGFFSHCGWNSIMESVSEGIPILGFPIGMDQFTNCKLVVDEWKFGLRGRSREDKNRIIEAEEIARKVKVLMEGEESLRLRGTVKRFRELAQEEVTNGLSATNLKLLADKLKAVKCPCKQ
ncbi:hypothetical protein SUGI_0373240 [Cryptomeria japonica]|uniref:UDP-glycosyltransferase 86A1-like n=1 Tax=Cryptomeria japonica TaxID=3369 RepID=UPI002408B17C|nr:UDP-glycosyltransferase 86A1-like [Cryptomeria japonica]GLJ20504.1 hypothetical protein SUGI_0373240 [Cryptomeria japonica]